MKKVLVVAAMVMAAGVVKAQKPFIMPEAGPSKVGEFSPEFEPSITTGVQTKEGICIGMGVGYLQFRNHSAGMPVFARIVAPFYTNKPLSPLVNMQIGYYALNDEKTLGLMKGGLYSKIGFGVISNSKIASYGIISFEAIQLKTLKGTDAKPGISFAVGVKI